MSNFELIYEWLKQCPQLNELWAISSMLEDNKNILQPNRAANMYHAEASKYSDGKHKIVFEPVVPYYFDVNIVLYRAMYTDENRYNIDVQDNLQAVCDWLIEQQNAENTPYSECYMIECLNPTPFIRGFYADENSNSAMVDYVITVRFYADNPAMAKMVIR